MPNDHKYYPALSQLISVDDLPDFLNFIKEQIFSDFCCIFEKKVYFYGVKINE